MLGASRREETVAVLFGGRSSEHEISLRSAATVLKNMPPQYHVIPVGIDRAGLWWSLEGSLTAEELRGVQAEDLKRFLEGGKPMIPGGGSGVETVFLPIPHPALLGMSESSQRVINLEAGNYLPVLHGPNGEDGRIQALCDLAEVAYIGPDHTTSAVGMDKSMTRRLVEHAGLPTLKWLEIAEEAWCEDPEGVLRRVEENIGFPAFVKPNALGSAVGVSRALDRESLQTAFATAFRFDERALVEEPAEATEVECAYLGNPHRPRVSIPGEIAPQDFYSYDEKYGDESGAQLFVPARLSEMQTQHVRALACRVAQALNIEGLSRIDFWWRATTEEFFFNEVNTLPGFTSISMFPKLWEQEGLSIERWLTEALETARRRQQRRQEKSHGLD